MSFGQAISYNLSNMTNFSGRASRPEFWWWILAIWLINFVVSIITGGFNFGGDTRGFLWYIGLVISIILWLATLAVTIRRLHDTGRSGWWVLLWFVCCIGAIVVIVFCIQPSQAGDNQYGPPPTA